MVQGAQGDVLIGGKITDVGLTGQPLAPIDDHAARAAHVYAAGETEGNTRILFLLDSQQNVQNGGGFGVVDSQLVALERPFAAFDRIVAEYAYVANNF